MSLSRTRRTVALLAPAAVLAALVSLPLDSASAAPSTTLVINEVYGGGGNAGSTLKNDFIEIKNIGTTTVDLSGWSLQYNSSGGASAFSTHALGGQVPPGATYLAQEAAGTGGTVDLPPPDATGSLSMSGTGGRVALVHSTTALSCAPGSCTTAANVVDFLGWGSAAADFEGTRAPATTNPTSVSRNASGADTDDNGADFTAGTPTPTACGQGCVVPPATVTIAQAQGAGHTSPYDGKPVAQVTGVITGHDGSGFWMQDPRGPQAPGYVDGASSGIYVFTSSAPAASLQPGTSVSVNGTVTEFHPGSTGLGVTEIGGTPTVTVVDPNAAPIAPTEIGPNGIQPPATVIDNDAAPGQQVDVEKPGGQYQPAEDGIDFWESLEGMLVDLPQARVVGPTNTAFGETPIVPAGSGTQTARGGIVLLQSDPNPERIVLDNSTGVTVPSANVGDTYAHATGNVTYDFGNFHLMASASPLRTSGGIARETTGSAANDELSVATFNVENLDPTDPQAKFDDLAAIIVDNLQAPDLLALEEVQDNTGRTDDHTVAANQTLEKLIAAIAAAGGPAYDYRQIDPVDDAEGGEPGGNIRVAFLIQDGTPLSFVDRDPGTSTTDTDVVLGTDGTPELTHSPGRVAPANSAWQATRVPLAGEFTFGGQKVFVVANHWSSKGGDQGLFGANQPPFQSSEAKRTQQAQVVNDFVDEIYAKDPDANVVVLGDLNDFEYSDSVTTLTDDGSALLDLPGTLPDSQRYTYVFEGNSQVLDHILLSQGLVDQTYDYDVVHANAEFSDQASDHDPQVVTLNLGLAASALSASASPGLVVYGSNASVTGALTDDASTPIAGATVTLQSRPAGSGSFSDAATSSTGPNGRYAFTVSPTANTEYRVVFAGDRTYAEATSPSVRVDVATRVSVTPGSTSVKRGNSTLFAGVVAPGHAGQTVQIQRLDGSTWSTIGTATLDQDSFYSFMVQIDKKEKKSVLSFRVVKPADADHVVGTSRTVDITVK